jgi:thiol-disulfide isomerase/thioredoxin
MSLRSFPLLVLSMTLLVAGCDRQSPDPAQPQTTPSDTKQGSSDTNSELNGTLDIANRGATMPDFAFKDIDGKTLKSSDLKGQPVLINLWATWCGPCVLEMPMLDALAAKTEGKLRVVTVSQDMGTQDKVKTFWASKSFAHLQPWLDPENELGFHYNTGLLPTTVLYDAQGKEVWRMIGAHDWSSARTDAMLADTLGK